MFWPLAMILMAVAAFGVLVTRRSRPTEGWSRIDSDQANGFVYVGSAALLVLALGVVVLGLSNGRDGRAESVAVLGFLAYGLYLVAAAILTYAWTRRRQE